jgi:thiamine-monophosphate kinase
VSEKGEYPTLADISESEVLSRIFPRLPTSDFALLGPGDDCAVVSAPDKRFVMTTDMMVQGPDFRLEWSTPWQLGFKAAATNLADVASMGAVPTALVVSLAAPAATQVRWLEEFADGLHAGCNDLAPGCGVVGGDLSVSSVLTVSITATGDLQGREPILRSGARDGDVIAYAGDLGQAALGLHALFTGQRLAKPELLNAQLQPQPPVNLGTVAAEAGATAGLDVSDSLAMDLGRIAKASNVSCRLDERVIDDLAAHLALEYGVDASEARQAILFGGEDHGLLMTFRSLDDVPDGFVILGDVSEGPHGVFLGQASLTERGWNPYAGWDGTVS